MTAPVCLTGLRILVVEDDMLIAIQIEEVLQGLGCVVVGPVGKLEAAMHLAEAEVIDAAQRIPPRQAGRSTGPRGWTAVGRRPPSAP